jgi:hypothetical protein
MTINELARRLDRLERIFERATTAQPGLIPGAVPEAGVLGGNGLPISEPAQVLGLCGAHSFLPPGCNVLVALCKAGQDPVILGGTGTPAAILAVQALAASYPAVRTGGTIIADLLTGACAIVITPTGGDLIGLWSYNGVPLT